MKSTFILTFLLVSFVGKAQLTDVIKQIEATRNKKLIENIQNQDQVFEALGSYLKEIGQEEFNARKDSINASRFSKLLVFYNQLDENIQTNYKAIKSKSENRLVDAYMSVRMKGVDSLYALFTSRRFVEKTATVNATENNVVPSNDVLVERRPIYELCAGTPDEQLCTANFITKKLGNNYSTPSLRDIDAQKLKCIVQFVINKKGEIVFATNAKSSGYFDYDMESIKVFAKNFAKDKFIPAFQNGKNVNCSYAVPITIMVPE